MNNYYYQISLIFVALSCVPFFIRFELKKQKAEKIVLIAIMAAAASLSRLPFAGLPGVQPVTFLVMVTAFVFGAETGFMTGAVAAIVSNIFLGHGPWTPWQILSWGFVGLASGILRKTPLMKNGVMRIITGLAFGFIFGMIMDFWFVLNIGGFTLDLLLFAFQMGFLFNLAHALSNAFFILIFFMPLVKILERIKNKYGLLD
jgi:energy-coupling factor transport system substrate-specific component